MPGDGFDYRVLESVRAILRWMDRDFGHAPMGTGEEIRSAVGISRFLVLWLVLVA